MFAGRQFRKSVGMVAALAAGLAIGPAPAGATPLSGADAERNQPAPPVQIADNLYHVGTRDIAVFLFADPKGLILLDAGYEQSVPLVLANIRALGFDPKRIRLLITSQAHFDHVAGLAEMKAATGARLIASREDAALLGRGGRGDFAFGDRFPYPLVKVDRTLADGEILRLGALRLTAHLTPGHTKGCTSWTTDAIQGGRTHKALFICGATAPGYRLVGNADYPQIQADFARSFATWRRLPCEIFLGAHGSYFGLEDKRAAIRPDGPNPFVDPEGCRAFLDRAEAGIQTEAKRQASE
jgi:metallo-beta-lactamase class B